MMSGGRASERLRIGLIPVWLLGAAGCAGGPDDGPPTVHFGQDVCAACTMIVSEERFASAIVARADGDTEPFVFDDVGCLFSWEKNRAEAVIVSRWARGYSSGGWIPADSAWYVSSAEIRSPMGSGIAACATREEAEQLARSRTGELLDWNRLAELGRNRGLLAPPPPASEG